MDSGVGHLPRGNRHLASLADPRNRVHQMWGYEIATANFHEKASGELRRIYLPRLSDKSPKGVSILRLGGPTWPNTASLLRFCRPRPPFGANPDLSDSFSTNFGE